MVMLERIAKAIYETWRLSEGADSSWEEVVEVVNYSPAPEFPHIHGMYRLAFAEARAVLDAMLEPTDGMTDAGHDAVGPFCDHNPSAAWRSMIQAAKDGA